MISAMTDNPGALRAAATICHGVERLNDQLDDSLDARLRFGIGIHTGIAVMGRVRSAGSYSFQFIGDVGNVASRLEASTKDLGCRIVASTQVIERAGLATDGLETRDLSLRGREGTIAVALINDPAVIEARIGA